MDIRKKTVQRWYHKKAFEVEISNGGPKGYETAITLKLPATWAEFHDALQKARITDGRNCGIELTRSWWAGLSPDLIGNARNLYELNLFAQRLTMLIAEELLCLDVLLKMEQAQSTKAIPLPKLINLTFNTGCHTLDLVLHREDGSDEELTYRLDDAEKADLREKMDAYCLKETGLSLDAYCDSLLEQECGETPELKL